MKTKKILITVLTAGILAASLTACGGSSNSSASSASSSAVSSASSASSSSAASVAGESVDTGVFTTFVPGEWLAYPQLDYSADADEEGNYPVDGNSYAMIKGGTSEFDCLSMPTVYVYYIDSASAADEAELDKKFYDESEDISVTVNGTECAAFEGKTSSIFAEGENDVYDFIFIPIDDSSCLQVTVPVTVFMDSKTSVGVSLDDADVQAILNGTFMD